ncbi:MAG: hypothetical protein KGY99_10690 [Phycisphaerae bacterium]|nr:hypothetical protein [Phycisphaerae bacterium]
MATFKLNMARIRGCPPPAAVDEACEHFGLPETEEFGVLRHTATETTAFATVIRKTQTSVQRLDADNREITSEPVEKVAVYPFGISPAHQRLEVYAGGAGAVEQVGVFLGSCLALPAVVDPVELDMPAAIDRVLETARRAQLVAVRVNEYAHNAYMSGPYAPKFLDSQHGRDFLSEYGEFVTSARLRFQAAAGRATVTLSPAAACSYSCNDDDQPEVQALLRQLV